MIRCCASRSRSCRAARAPSAEELQQSLDFLSQRSARLQQQTPASADPLGEALVSLCQVILSSNEFMYVE
jgi:hypothetical protein